MPRSLWVAVATSLALFAFIGCDDGGSPTAACALECGDNGSCVVDLGGETCVCAEGYEGEGCASCEAGYVPDGAACVLDPCALNPCDGPHQSACEAVPGGYACVCDDDAQDHDGDNQCRPNCAEAVIGFGTQTCDDSSGDAVFTGLRSRDTVVRWVAEGPAPDQLYIAGEFNGWDNTADVMVAEGGVFSATLNLPIGDYGYKLYDPASDTWFEDMGNPLHKWVDGTRNSRLRVEDLGRTLLRLMHTPEVEGDAVRFKVQRVQGTGTAAFAPVVVTRDGLTITATYDEATGVASVVDEGLTPGKYHYRVTTPGADPVYVPIWIEAAPFDWRDAVLYFVLTDRFADGDASNNAPVANLPHQANWQGGDFAGLRQQIEAGYFDALGVNAIWISSPIRNTAGDGGGLDGRNYAAYHSYWPTATGWTDEAPLPGMDTPIDPHFGTMAELKGVVDAAHARGIRVLVDFVANHVHHDSPLWRDHEHDTPPWFHLPAQNCQDIDWSRPIECWFAHYLPDFNYQNAAVVNIVVDHAWWLVRETGVDGFRLDAVKHMVDDFSMAVRGHLATKLRYSDVRFYMVGETFTGEDGGDLLRHYVNPEMLDGQFDFPLFWKTLSVFLREEQDLRGLEGHLAAMDGFYGEFAVMSNFIGNHDVCRATSHANGDIGDLWCNGGKAQGWDNPPAQPSDATAYAKLRLAWTFLFATPGVPLIYYGDEIGLAGAGDPDNRRFMQFNVAGQQAEVLAHVQAVSAVRATHPALRRGARQTLEMHGDGLLWAYKMSTEGDDVVVVFNRASEPRTLRLDASALPWAPDAVTDPLGRGTLNATADSLELTLPGHEAALLVAE